MAVLARFAAAFRSQLHAPRASLHDLPPGTDPSRHAALLLHRLMLRRFLREAGFEDTTGTAAHRAGWQQRCGRCNACKRVSAAEA